MNLFGIDKVVVSGLDLDGFNQTLVDATDDAYLSVDGKNRVKAKVIDKGHDAYMEADYGFDDGESWCQWVHLGLSADFNNLKPRLMSDVRTQEKQVVKSLAVKGIVLDDFNSRIKSIEVNRTFNLTEEWKDYLNVFRFIIKCCPSSVKTPMQVGRDNNVTVYLKWDSFTLKIYDKGKQLLKEKGVDVGAGTYCRVEYIFTGEKLKRELGTNKLTEVTDESLLKLFNKQFEKDIISQTNKKLDETVNRVERLILMERHDRTKNPKTYADRALMSLVEKDIDVLFDVELFKQGLKRVDKVNYNRTYRRLINTYDVSNHMDNLKKLREFTSCIFSSVLKKNFR